MAIVPLAEPTTSLTDYALALVALALGARLVRGPGPAPLSRRLLGAGFLLAGLAALLGGTLHGFAPGFSVALKAGLWDLTYGAVGLASTLVATALAAALLPRAARGIILAALGLRIALGLAVGTPVRLLPYDFALVVVALLAGSLALGRRREPAAPWILAGLLASLLGAFVQVHRIAPHPAFNHNDLFHLVQAAALGLLYRGGRALREGGERA